MLPRENGAGRQHPSSEKVQLAESVVDRGDSQVLTSKFVSSTLLLCIVIFICGSWMDDHRFGSC